MKSKVKKTKIIKGLRKLAQQLGYKVVLKKTKEMDDSCVGLVCPDINTIYVDPNKNDTASTLAHEIGHVILFILQPPGHGDSSDTFFKSQIGENAADYIGKAILSSVGYNADYTSTFNKAIERIKSASNLFSDSLQEYAFVRGYCAALTDMLINSIGGEEFERITNEIISIAWSKINERKNNE